MTIAGELLIGGFRDAPICGLLRSFASALLHKCSIPEARMPGVQNDSAFRDGRVAARSASIRSLRELFGRRLWLGRFCFGCGVVSFWFEDEDLG